MLQFFYYKMQQFCYKMWHLLQNATYITNCESAYPNDNQDYSKTLTYKQWRFSFGSETMSDSWNPLKKIKNAFYFTIYDVTDLINKQL